MTPEQPMNLIFDNGQPTVFTTFMILAAIFSVLIILQNIKNP